VKVALIGESIQVEIGIRSSSSSYIISQ